MFNDTENLILSEDYIYVFYIYVSSLYTTLKIKR